MKTIAIVLDLSTPPFKLDLSNLSSHLEMQMRLKDPKGYLGKVMAANDGYPFAMLFAYGDEAQPAVQDAIDEMQGVIAQAALAFGGWSYWDSYRREIGIHEFLEEDNPELYSALIANLKLESASSKKPQ